MVWSQTVPCALSLPVTQDPKQGVVCCCHGDGYFLVPVNTHVSSLTAYVRVLRECIRAAVSVSGLVPLESALISNLRCLFPACHVSTGSR